MLNQGFRDAAAHEGTIWLVDDSSQHLVPAYNTGPNAAKFVRTFHQPLNEGIICMVFATEQPFLENEVYKNLKQSRRLDSLLQMQTYALIAVPFYLLKNCRGVVSCVQLRPSQSPASDPAGFNPNHLAAVQRASGIVSRLLEYQLLSRTVDWAAD